MGKLIFLGTAASVATKTRDTTSFVFVHKKVPFLIECPGSIVYKLYGAGIDFTKLKNVIITHQHPDHVYGILHLIHAQYRLNDELTIFTNAPTQTLIRKMIRLMNLNKPHYPRVRFVNVFTQKYFYLRSGLKICAIKNAHIPSSFGVKFSFANTSVLYSSDTRPIESIINAGKKSTHLIHDCTGSSSYFKKYPQLKKMHTDSETLCETFKDMPLKKIIPVHFLLLRKGEEQRIKKELIPLGKKLYFPNDFDRLKV